MFTVRSEFGKVWILIHPGRFISKTLKIVLTALMYDVRVKKIGKLNI